jgi:hypothetical protein
VDFGWSPCYRKAVSEAGAELLERVMALEPMERRALAEEIMARVQESDEDAELLSLASGRWDEFLSGSGMSMGHEELMESLRA